MESFEGKANVKTVNGQAPDGGGNVEVGFGNIDEVLPLEKGGTGKTTAADVRMVLGLGRTAGALPIANGGTGAATLEQARKNLGINEIVTTMSDFVTDIYIADDGKQWYRLWKSGFTEQGGVINVEANTTSTTVTLLQVLDAKNTEYIVLLTPQIDSSYDRQIYIPKIRTKNDSNFTFTMASDKGGKLMWYVCGQRYIS